MKPLSTVLLTTATIALLSALPIDAAPTQTLRIGGFSGGTIQVPIPDSPMVQDSPMNETPPNSTSTPSNIVQQVQSMISGIPNSLNTLLTSKLGDFHIPTLDQLFSQIMGSNTADTLSNVLENSPESSMLIKQDAIKAATRGTAIKTAADQTLGQTAQQQLMQRAEQVDSNTQQNTQLGQRSQSSNVSQEILKNVSQQLSLDGQMNQQVLEELQQSRVDHAIGNTLTAQIEDDLSSMNTTTRRENISAGTALSQQTGLLMMPGGYSLNSTQTSTRP